VHLLRHNLLQYIRQAVASQNHPTISYTPNSGNVVQRQHGGCIHFTAVWLLIVGCSLQCASLIRHGYCGLKAFLVAHLSKSVLAQLGELWFRKLLMGFSETLPTFSKTLVVCYAWITCFQNL
jgi:hypothetical protein